MEMKWWEKTVEYYFIIKYLYGENKTFIAPLDGKEEKAGDTVFSQDNKWIIIEFKKDENSLSLEKKKYINYEKAKTNLSNKDGHHFLIYGEIKNNKFVLQAKTYFSENYISDIKNVFSLGTSKEKFIEYIKELAIHKSTKNTSESGSVGGYQLIAGINKDNNVVSCMKLEEFAQENIKDIKIEQKLEKATKHEHEKKGIGLDM